MLENHPEQSVSRRVVAESLAQPLADEREAPHLHDALTQQPVPWRMVLDLERDV